jgi:hypothetical protein
MMPPERNSERKMLQNSQLNDLFAAYNPSSATGHELAYRYAPIIRFDAREPFLPLAAGYTIFKADGPSPSFPRHIELKPVGLPPAVTAIEYAIWWDWDIQHLYELEHIWVYIDQPGKVVRAEASWHGDLRDVAGKLPLTGERLTLFSEPGKHAFAPIVDWLIQLQPFTTACCTSEAGNAGICTPPVIEGYVYSTPEDDQRIKAYLMRQAFIPTMQFTQLFDTLGDCLLTWPLLFAWIPARVEWWMAELHDLVSSD